MSFTKANLPHLNQQYESEYDKTYPYSQIGGWVCDTITGDKKYKLDFNDWTYKADGTLADLTGADGDVMVSIPAFYYKTKLNSNNQYDYTICDITPKLDGSNCPNGFKIHEAFLLADGAIKPYILVGAYKGHILNNQLRSVSGVKPTVSRNIANFTADARQGRNTLNNHHDITRFYERLAINMLIYIEFGTLNTQTAIGQGWSTMTESNVTGTTNSLGDRSGYVGDTNGKASVRWRGIEDLWGNVWEFVTGFMISDEGYWFTNDPDKFLNMRSMEHHAKDLTAKVTAGYIKTMEVIPGKEFSMIPATTDASSNTYYCDYFWPHDSGEENIALVGGHWVYDMICGAACWNCFGEASFALSYFGARLSCSKRGGV